MVKVVSISGRGGDFSSIFRVIFDESRLFTALNISDISFSSSISRPGRPVHSIT